VWVARSIRFIILVRRQLAHVDTSPASGVNLRATSTSILIFGAAMGGTSREYLLSRLRKNGHFALVAAVERGDISAFQAAEHCGYVTRRPIAGGGSENAAKLRTFRLHRVLRDIEAQQEGDEALAPAAEPPRRTSDRMAVAGGMGDLPCLYCSNPQAHLARREIADTFIANQMGVRLRMACCRALAADAT
jgi:hypothetical protein